MDWNLQEAISYFKTLGAPKDQSALISLLREVQQESQGSIPMAAVGEIAGSYGIRETYLLAVIKRIPSLRIKNEHCLELCAGQNCGKHTALAAYAEKLHTASGKKFTFKLVPCMRMCGRGPNLKWDGKVYHQADNALLKKLLKDAGMDF